MFLRPGRYAQNLKAICLRPSVCPRKILHCSHWRTGSSGRSGFHWTRSHRSRAGDKPSVGFERWPCPQRAHGNLPSSWWGGRRASNKGAHSDVSKEPRGERDYTAEQSVIFTRAQDEDVRLRLLDSAYRRYDGNRFYPLIYISRCAKLKLLRRTDTS